MHRTAAGRNIQPATCPATCPLTQQRCANGPARSGRRPDRPHPTPSCGRCRRSVMTGRRIRREASFAPRATAARARLQHASIRSAVSAPCLICPVARGRGCGPWTVLPLLHAGADATRVTRESRACMTTPLFRVSHMHVNKKQPFRRGFEENFSVRDRSHALPAQKTAAASLPRRFRSALSCRRDAYARSFSGTKSRFSGPV